MESQWTLYIVLEQSYNSYRIVNIKKKLRQSKWEYVNFLLMLKQKDKARNREWNKQKTNKHPKVEEWYAFYCGNQQ